MGRSERGVFVGGCLWAAPDPSVRHVRVNVQEGTILWQSEIDHGQGPGRHR
jgi:hypothetical protein